MRLSGFALLFVGFVLCITIAWAAPGFLVMSCGLICLLIAEERKKKQRLSQVANKPIGPDRARTFRPPIDNKARRNERAREAVKWTSIVTADPDIKRVVEILSQYGPSYVDQLARVYLVFEDKTLLPIILELIITSAKKHMEASKTNPDSSASSVEAAIVQSSAGRLETSDHPRQRVPEMALPIEAKPDFEMEGNHTQVEPSSFSGDSSGAQSDSGELVETAVTKSPLTSDDLSTLLAILANAK